MALPAIEVLIARSPARVAAVTLLDRLRSSPHPDLSRLAWDVGP
ncbi:hypothetical protein AB0G00_03710 [Nocardia salmonicida]